MDQKGKAGEEGTAKYDKEATEFARSGKPKKAAVEAERALDNGEEKKSMREAEQVGRAPAQK